MNPGRRPRLTRRGRGVLAAAGGLLLAARLFGSVELAGLAASAAAVVGAGALVVRRAPMTYRADRWLAPMRVAVGGRAQARLRFTNTGPGPIAAGAVALDGVAGGEAGAGAGGEAGAGAGVAAGGSGRRGARRRSAPQPPATPTRSGLGRLPQGVQPPGACGGCLVPPLGRGAMAEAAYELPTGRRGPVAVGPLVISVGDLLGLAERRLEVAGTARLVVHPRIRPVLALPASSTRRTRHGPTRPVRSPQGDDFFALREYEVGDDLRRVHWRSTARTGDLMLRQDELRFGEAATVLLDTRASAHGGDSFERALEVAASIAAALVEDGRRLRFVSTGGFDVELDGAGAGGGGRQDGKWAAVLDHLAEAVPDAGSAERFAFAVQSIRRDPGGPLAAVVGDVTPGELAALGALRPRLGLVLIAQVQQQPPQQPAAGTADHGQSVPGALLVPVHQTDDFPEAWNQAVLSCGRRDVVPR